MPAHRLLPDDWTLLQLRHQGWTYQDIADKYGVTVHAVSRLLGKIPGGTRARPINKDIIPWTVKVQHAHAPTAERLREAGRVRRGERLDEFEQRRLDEWISTLEHKVVDYDPDLPPIPEDELAPEDRGRVSNVGGWRLVPRSKRLDLPFDRDNPMSFIRRPRPTPAAKRAR